MNQATKLFAILLTVSALFIGTRSNAQSIQKSKLRFGIGLDGLAPVGQLSKSTNFGLGITPRLQYGINDHVAITFTSGLYHFFPKAIPAEFNGQQYTIKNDLDLIPVKLGLKAFVTSNIYIGAEAGIGFQVDNGGGDSKFMSSGGFGYANKKWDVGVRYENFKANGYSNNVIGLRVAYGFGL
ncbi:hypothetical protein D0C36_22450 [Mucilaginibacter conchicola]|uniref:Outer membrane protein beta-barrel domain-containing protein n=1 Tax=Mucilaginibacter conchicola TaxID=2303333 RepID=A0A372NQK6_9SPHI|nr:outer membrane beta-barrel protein [Mucilaginibacter conchicola]RFZ90543.1 hypothetical protein D0C36_22450 [Mucilaginibacter conchicola]